MTLGLAAAAAMALLCLAVRADARPFTVDDLLHQEAFGARAIDPGGRWLVFERRDPYDTAARYDHDGAMGAALSRLQVVDLAHPGPARPLLAADPGPGVTLAGFSPSGARLAVYRLNGAQWTLGVVTLATGAVRWFDITPEDPPFGRALQWLSNRELLVLDRPDGVPPWYLRNGRVSATQLPKLWAASAGGERGAVALGSGAYRVLRPRPTPRRLLRLDVATGDRQVLASGPFIDLEVSPDRARVALLETGEDLQPEVNGPAQGAAGTATQATRLSLVDLATGARRQPCPSCDVLPTLLSWSPDSSSLLIFARGPKALWTEGRFQRIRAATGAVRALGDGLRPQIGYRPELVGGGWMGGVPIIYAQPESRADARFDWYRLSSAGPINLTRDLPAGPRKLAVVAPDRLVVRIGTALWQVDPRGAAARLRAAPVAAPPLSTGGYAPRLDAALLAGSWLVTGEGDGRRLGWLDARGLHSRLALTRRDMDLLAAAQPAAALVRDTDPRGLETLRLLRRDAPPVVLAEANAPLAATDAPVIRPIHHRGPDGQALTSWLYLPPASSDSPPPLVVRPYSGGSYPVPPRELYAERGFMTDVRTLVGHGYAVLVPSLPLPRDRGDPVAGLAGRILAVVDAAAADPALAGAFDPGRLALWGHSYGGYTVMAVIGQTDRFKAAVAIAGFSDLISKWAALPAVHRVAPEEGLRANWSAGAVEQGQDGMQVPPWRDPERYLRNSPLLAANRIATPLLLAHGDQDIIPLPQSEAMFAALYRQDKDAILLTYFGEGHGLRSPGNVRDLFAQAFGFLDAHLAAPVSDPRGARSTSPGPGPASTEPRPLPTPPTRSPGYRMSR